MRERVRERVRVRVRVRGGWELRGVGMEKRCGINNTILDAQRLDDRYRVVHKRGCISV